MTPSAGALDLNPADLRGLDWLVDGPKTAGELSEGTGLSSAGDDALIDRLERKGFVQRVRDEVDRRRVLVEMTPEGATQGRARTTVRMVQEGRRAVGRRSRDDQLEAMREFLVAARELTDRQRRAIRG